MPNATLLGLDRKYNLRRMSHDPDLDARIRRGKEGAQAIGSVASLIGENPLEVAGTALGFYPLTAIPARVGIGLLGLGYTTDAEAGPLQYLKRLGSREQVTTEAPGSLSYGVRDTVKPNYLFNKTFATPHGTVVEHSHPSNTAPILSSTDLTYFIEQLNKPWKTVSPLIRVTSPRGEFEISPKFRMSPAKYAVALDELRHKYDLEAGKRLSRLYRDEVDPMQKGALLSGHSKLDVKFNGRKYAAGGLAKRIGKMFDKDPVPPKLQGTQIIKEPGGNWVAGAVEKALRPLRNPARDIAVRDPNNPATQEAYRKADAYNRWLDTKLTKYIKNEMATQKDPVRALAEEGTLHVAPEHLNFRVETHGEYLAPGQTAVARHPAAKAWEGASDLVLGSTPAGQRLAQGEVGPGMEWLSKVPPETPVYEIGEPRGFVDDLGFSHLADELRNAIDPASGLPANLLWKPSDLEKVTVPQAVQRVSDINAWRAAKKAEADLALSTNPATHVFREYPEQGLKWVELKMPEAQLLPEGYSLDKSGNVLDHHGNYTRDPRGQSLEDALNYEGDTMGHCVGGYCEDVLSGDKRVFSLRDEKGMPHVTIETRPPLVSIPREQLIEASSMSPEEFEAASRKMGNAFTTYKDALERGWLYHPDVPYWINSESLLPSIRQIKGSGKKDPGQRIRIKGTGYENEPDAWLLPAVQDFVKSREWDEVRDIANTALVQLPDRRFITKEQFNEGIQRLTNEGAPSINGEWFNRQLRLRPDWWDEVKGAFEGFAEGGLVEADPDLAQELLRRLKLSGSVSSFEDGKVKGIGGGGNVSYEVSPSLTLGADVSGYRVDTPVGNFSDKSLSMLRGEYRSGPHTVRARKGVGDNKKAWGVEYQYNFAEGGLVDNLQRYGRSFQLGVADLVGIKPEMTFANDLAKKYFPEGQSGGKGDAMRHLLFQAKLSQKSPLLAKGVSYLHEYFPSGQSRYDRDMDLHNDRLGRELGAKYLDDAELLFQAEDAVLKGKAKTVSSKQRQAGYADGGLVQYDPAAIDSMVSDLRGMIYG